jgi:hypothetical protein
VRRRLRGREIALTEEEPAKDCDGVRWGRDSDITLGLDRGVRDMR